MFTPRMITPGQMAMIVIIVGGGVGNMVHVYHTWGAKDQDKRRGLVMNNRVENWTPHTVLLVRDGGEDLAFESVGQCRAVSRPMEPAVADTYLGRIVTVQPPEHSAIEWSHPDGKTAWMARAAEGVEDLRPGTVIVSSVVASLVAKASPEFRVWVPDTGPGSVVLDEDGQIVGVRRMVQHSPGRGGEIRANYVPDPSQKR